MRQSASEKTNQRTWDPKLAKHWQFVRPPGRPSSSEVRIYRKYLAATLKRYGNIKVLILGSTVELRDLCLAMNIEPLCVDYHRDNFYILRKLMKKHGKESLKVADWRKMMLPHKFHCILGDIAFQMVPTSDNERIFKCLKRIMIPDGIIVHRNWIRIRRSYTTLKQIIKEHKRRRHMPTFTSLAMPFLQHVFDDKKGLFYMAQRAVPKVEEAYEKGYISYNEYMDMYNAWSEYRMPNYLPTRKEFETMAKRYFSIENVEYGRNWYKRFAPIYVLRSK